MATDSRWTAMAPRALASARTRCIKAWTIEYSCTSFARELGRAFGEEGRQPLRGGPRGGAGGGCLLRRGGGGSSHPPAQGGRGTSPRLGRSAGRGRAPPPQPL